MAPPAPWVRCGGSLNSRRRRSYPSMYWSSPMIVASGPRLVDLLGLSMTDERVGLALQSLGVAVPEVTPYEELDVTMESLGVDIRFEPPVQLRDPFGVPDDGLVMSMLFFHGTESSSTPYRGELPFGLSLEQTRP